jgi:hypothetical protein
MLPFGSTSSNYIVFDKQYRNRGCLLLKAVSVIDTMNSERHKSTAKPVGGKHVYTFLTHKSFHF